MAKYFAGTRSLLFMRRLNEIFFTSVAGRFDPLYVPGGVFIDIDARIEVPIGMDATSVTTLWGHFDFYTDTSLNISGNSHLLAFLNTSDEVVARLVSLGNNNTQFQFWNGSTYVSAGPIFSLSRTVLSTIDFRIVAGAAGSFQLWRDGFLVTSASGLSAAFGNIATVRFVSLAIGNHTLSQVALSDFDMRGWKFPSDILTSPGTYNEGTGTLGDMGDRNLNTSYILPTNGTRVTGASAARALPSGFGMRSVHVNGTMRVSSPIANARHILRVGSTDFQSPNLAPALTPGYDIRGFYWDNNPATSSVWNISDYNSAQKGHVAIT